jgi:hypothetical protein
MFAGRAEGEGEMTANALPCVFTLEIGGTPAFELPPHSLSVRRMSR